MPLFLTVSVVGLRAVFVAFPCHILIPFRLAGLDIGTISHFV